MTQFILQSPAKMWWPNKPLWLFSAPPPLITSPTLVRRELPSSWLPSGRVRIAQALLANWLLGRKTFLKQFKELKEW